MGYKFKKRILLIFNIFFLVEFIFAQDKPLAPEQDISSFSKQVILKVITSPPHAKIFINSSYYGISPLDIILVGPGDYTVEARLQEQATSAQVSITQEKYAEINLKFSPQPLNIVPFIILSILTGMGILIFKRTKTKEVKYSSLERIYK
jgi:hypothetical protein